MGYVKFLGTAGARFVMIKQMRASGGLWISDGQSNILIDPGPGALVRALKSRPKLDPCNLNGLVLTHKHLDHSNDINVMIEAMTGGGHVKKGIVLAPEDCFGKEGVIFDYLVGFPKKIGYLKEGRKYNIGDISVEAVVKMIHSVEAYGLKIGFPDTKMGIITDTGYFENLAEYYKKLDLLVINVVLNSKREGVEHLCLEEAEELMSKARPKKAILTHFGMAVLKNDLYKLGKELSRKVNIEVTFAYDGMQVNI